MLHTPSRTGVDIKIHSQELIRQRNRRMQGNRSRLTQREFLSESRDEQDTTHEAAAVAPAATRAATHDAWPGSPATVSYWGGHGR